MKRLSIRVRITLWFAAVLILITTLACAAVLVLSGSVMQKTIQDNLLKVAADNVDEVEFFSSYSMLTDDFDNDADHYMAYKNGYLEIDDDFLDAVNGVYTALYQSDATMLYGENPVSRAVGNIEFEENRVAKVKINGTLWYVYDSKLTREGLEELWLRSVVSAEQGTNQLNAIAGLTLIILPVLVLIAIAGGYLIASRVLNPIRTIAETARQINSGRDLKKRIGLGKGKDELHTLANTFDEMFDRLDASFEAEKQFTSDASHELRTPISVIMAQCEYTLEQRRSEEEYIEALEIIERQGNRMSHLISDMLTFTRLERKSEAITMELTDFSALASSVCEDMALIRENSITLTYEIRQGIEVFADRKLLTRVLVNLIGNAYRYGKANGYIKVRLSAENKKAYFSVEDNGIGISQEDQEKIFNRFYQADSARSGNGTGLGLSMVQEIVRLHGGEINVESEPGKGSTFTFVIDEIKDSHI